MKSFTVLFGLRELVSYGNQGARGKTNSIKRCALTARNG